MEIDNLGRKRADLLASWSGLVASHETAPLEMEAVGLQLRAGSRRSVAHTEDPVFHVILSRRPGEAVRN